MKVEYPSLDRLSAANLFMQLFNGGAGSPEGDDANAMPSLVISETGDCMPLTDGDAVEGSEFTANSFIIADAVMKSLASSLTASHVLGATCFPASEISQGHLPLGV